MNVWTTTDIASRHVTTWPLDITAAVEMAMFWVQMKGVVTVSYFFSVVHQTFKAQLFLDWGSILLIIPTEPKCSAILSFTESVYVWSNPFPSKPSIVFLDQKPFYSQPNYSSWWLGMFLVLSNLVIMTSSDLNKNKGVAEMLAPFISMSLKLIFQFKYLFFSLKFIFEFLPTKLHYQNIWHNSCCNEWMN